MVNTLEEVTSSCPYEGGYDLLIGTSDKGELLEEYDFKKHTGFKHACVFFGGLEGIEGMLEEESTMVNAETVRSMFNMYLNTCPDQGTMTIRTEEAILVSLAGILPRLKTLSE